MVAKIAQPSKQGFIMKIVHQEKFIAGLTRGLKGALPGIEAQNRMAHKVRRRKMTPPDDVRIACVLALFYPKNNEWHTVLMERVSNTIRDKHKGQISFPGGKLEEHDASFEAAALREAKEEVNVNPKEVRVLGRLTELYIPVSNFLVYPVVGFSEEVPDLKPEPSEVANILEVPFEHFMRTEHVKTADLKIAPHITLREVPYFDINGQMLWGATAMMMSELLEVVKTI